MSGKAPLPSLTGHRLKTRKRDEKKQYDPLGFRDAIFEGLNDSKGDLEAVFRYLDAAGSKLDYRRYGVNLIEILIAGGLLAPGGLLVEDGDPPHKTETCLFDVCAPGDVEGLKAFDQVLFVKLMRRYKYLEKMHEEEMNKILVYLKGFSHDQRTILAQITALWLASGQLPATLLPILINEHQVKDGTALEFLLEVLSTLKSEKGGSAVINIIKKSGMDTNLMEFFPAHNQQQTKENFAKTFNARDLPEVVTFKEQQEEQRARYHVQRLLKTAIVEEKPSKEIVEFLKKNKIPENDSIVMIWTCVMSTIEWSKKEDLLQDQALRHIRRHVPLFKAFSSNNKSEMGLINKIQEFCYDNMNFLKTFNKIILLLYKTDVLSEDVILKWYREGHSQRGWSVFMDQMKKFIEWLEKAEEGKTKDQKRMLLEESEFFHHGSLHPWTLDSKLFTSLKDHIQVTDWETFLKLPLECHSEKAILQLLESTESMNDENLFLFWKMMQRWPVPTESIRSACERMLPLLSPKVIEEDFRRLLLDLIDSRGEKNTPPPNHLVFNLITSSTPWFTEFIRYYLASLRSLNYEGTLLSRLPIVVSRIHSHSHSPIALYPLQIQELVSYLDLIQKDEATLSVMEPRLTPILKRLLKEDAFDLKVLVFMFPGSFKTLLNSPRFEFLSCLVPDNLSVHQCLTL